MTKATDTPRTRIEFHTRDVLFAAILSAISGITAGYGFAVYKHKAHNETAAASSQGRDAFSAELNTTFAEPLARHGITEIDAAGKGLRFVSNGKTMCVIDVDTFGADRWRIIEMANKHGCDETSAVALLATARSVMLRGGGQSLLYTAKADVVVHATRAVDGKWVTPNFSAAGWVMDSETPKVFAGLVVNDIEGLMRAVESYPSLFKAPAQLQAAETAL